jgi:hypothetical protein
VPVWRDDRLPVAGCDRPATSSVSATPLSVSLRTWPPLSEEVAASGGPLRTSEGPLRTSEGPMRTSEHETSTSSLSGGHVLSDTDSGVADTEDVAGRSHPATGSRSSRHTGTRPRTSTHATSSSTQITSATTATSTSSSSNVDLQTLRDPSHYEELNVIGNGMFIFCFFWLCGSGQPLKPITL